MICNGQREYPWGCRGGEYARNTTTAPHGRTPPIGPAPPPGLEPGPVEPRSTVLPITLRGKTAGPLNAVTEPRAGHYSL